MNFASSRKFHMRLELRTSDSMVRASGPGGPPARISIRLRHATTRWQGHHRCKSCTALRGRAGARLSLYTTLHPGSVYISEGQLSTIAGWGHYSLVTQGTVSL